VPAAQEHPILDRDRAQLTRAHADERHRRPGFGFGFGGGTVLAGPPHHAGGREQVPFPRLRADGVPEQRVVVPAPQAVGAAVLLIRPPGGQIGR
jgi:hypothetical protein